MVELRPYKRRRVSVIVRKEPDGGYSYEDQIIENEGENQLQ